MQAGFVSSHFYLRPAGGRSFPFAFFFSLVVKEAKTSVHFEPKVCYLSWDTPFLLTQTTQPEMPSKPKREMKVKSLVAQVALPLLMSEEADFVRTEIAALHEEVAFEYSTEIASGTTARVVVRKAPDADPPTQEEQISFVLTRQQIEAQLERLLLETKKARIEHRAPVSPFR